MEKNKKTTIVRGNFQYLNPSNVWIAVVLEVDVSSASITIYTKKTSLLQADLEFVELKEDESLNGHGDRSFELSVLGESYTLKCSSKLYEKWVPKIKQLKSGKRNLSTSQLQDLEDIELVEKDEDNENDPKTPLTQSRVFYDDEEPENAYDRNNALAKLPDETLIKIWSYLDPRDVGRLARVCKRFKRVSYDLPLWKEMFVKQNWNKYQDAYQAQSKAVSRSYFVKQFLSFNRREKEAKQRLAEVERQRALNASKNRASKIMVAFGWSRIYEWLLCIAVLWVTIIGALKLDEKIHWNWAAALVPMYVAVPPLILNPISRLFARCKYDYDFEDELDPEHDDGFLGPICFTLMYIFPLHLNFGQFYVPAMGSSFGTWILLFVIRLATGATKLKWWIVFLPMFCWQILLIGTFITGNTKTILRDRRRFDRIMCILFILLTMAFFILLSLQLDHYIDWSWHVIMSPLYALKCLVAFTAVLLTLIAMYDSCCTPTWSMEDYTMWGQEPWGWCAGCAVMSSLLIVPLLTFEVLLAQKLNEERDTSYVLIFVPMFLLEGFSLILMGVLNVVFCFD